MATKNVYELRGPVAPGTVVWAWTVLSEAPPQHGLRFLQCRCICGTERAVFIRSLRVGLSKSCGCQHHVRRSHRLSQSAEYSVWRAMIQRCHNPKSDAFQNYGARGITVCDRWRFSSTISAANGPSGFSAFIADMGRRPSPELTIERINNDGNYEPGNVRWATRKEQLQNTRLTHEDRVLRGRAQALKRWHAHVRKNTQ